MLFMRVYIRRGEEEGRMEGGVDRERGGGGTDRQTDRQR